MPPFLPGEYPVPELALDAAVPGDSRLHLIGDEHGRLLAERG